ncbi:MAG: DUF5666 domain-containing protein [Rubrivivax sp.]|nr:DUF5666 domain-containing protein [Rubrivivax sp.]
MSKLQNPTRRQALFTATGLAAAALLGACGGGGDASVAAPLTPATPADASTYTLGAITGFGSVIVGGVRFDDSRAQCVDEDDNPRDRNLLKLGMVVAVEAGVVNRGEASALALRIRLGSEVVGPVGGIDTAASTVQVLGQTVLVTTSTLFDETLSGGLAALTLGQVVEVHGILDPANGRIVATRIEAEDSATVYKLRGQLQNLDTTAKTFTVNGQVISYTGLPAALVPPGLTNGQIVRVLLQTTQVNGAWVAIALRGGLRLPDRSGEAHLEGVITAFTSLSSFSVNGMPVDATNAAFPDGTVGIALGARVEVEGSVSNGVLVAAKVEIEERRTLGLRPLELRGELGNLNATDKTFALRGVTVWFGGTVDWRDGSEATLANGRRVEVRGVLSADRTRLEARRIDFK